MKNPTFKVVIPKKRTKSINFGEYIFKPNKRNEITTLTSAQQEAIKKIEEYWINRFKAGKNWKNASHWSYKKESISTRMSESEFLSLKSKNKPEIINNFIRLFLRNQEFRFEIIERMDELVKYDAVNLLDFAKDITDVLQILIEYYPCVVSAKVLNVEKEIFTFYFRFICIKYSVSYAIRCALIGYEEFEYQEPLKPDEVPGIMFNLLKNK